MVWGQVPCSRLTLSCYSCSCSKHPHSLCRSPSTRDHGSEWQLWRLKFLCSSKKSVIMTPPNTPPHRSVQHAKELGRNLPTGQPASTLHVSANWHPSIEPGKGFSKGLSLSGTGLTPPNLFHTNYNFMKKALFKCQMQQQV